jgi:hypothetical protein
LAVGVLLHREGLVGRAVGHPPELAGLHELPLPEVLPEVLHVPPRAHPRVGVYPNVVVNPAGPGGICGNKDSAVEGVMAVANTPAHVSFGVSVYFYGPRALSVRVSSGWSQLARGSRG